MKKLLNVFALIACFTFLASSSLDAQAVVRNATDCTFRVQITYAKIGLCEAQGTVTINVAPFTMVSPIIPPGHEIIESQGIALSPDSCPFGIGGNCSAFPLVDDVNCDPLSVSTICGNYTAEWTSLGIWIHP